MEIPENKIKQLKEKGFEKIEDIANCLPSKYSNFEPIISVSDMPNYENEIVTIYGKILYTKQGHKHISAILEDENGDCMKMVWFNQSYIERTLFNDGRKYVVCGKVSYDSFQEIYSIVSPILCTYRLEEYAPIAPVYPKIKGMSVDYFKQCIKKAVGLMIAKKGSCDYLEADLRKKFGVVDYKTFLVKAHAPENETDVKIAQKRTVVDELFPFALKMGIRRNEYNYDCPYKMQKTDVLNKFINSLPYKLTTGQSDAIKTLVADAVKQKRIDSLVQGDVGCGKTVIAMAMSAFIAENGYQCAVMCPTSVLAMQHFEKFKEALGPFGIKVALYVNDIKAKEKRELLKQIKNGEIQIVVGTHALISNTIEFSSLALTVIDEEHRFGVKQREKLREKGNMGIHSISMSATPIPRTLALTVYGENVNVINIETMPQGRKPVETIVYSNEEKVYHSIYNQIKLGHQAYVVCPLIEASNAESLEGVESVEETYEKMAKWFSKYPDVKISIISGNMKQAEIQKQLDDFSKGNAHILISTTIVEVGVNVPNSTVIMIKNAERFGLAQLHQLRGRVGRGDAQGYCVLLSKFKNIPRLQVMAETNDGFLIAEKDLELRGTGDVVGTKQSGVDKCVTLMLQNSALYRTMCKEVDEICNDEKRLLKYKKSFSEE